VAIGFHPAGSPIPREKRTERLSLRPLRTSDAERDYDAVMSSAAELRRCRGSEWPSDDFSLAENLADLERHEREHDEGTAFTYTVLAPDEARCLGCVYIVPVWLEAAGLCEGAAHAACVGFWVRTSEWVNDLDRHLLAALRAWLKMEWSFDCVLFTNYAGDTRQAALLAETSLSRLPLVWPDGRTGLAFRMERSGATRREDRKALVRQVLETPRPAGVYRVRNKVSGKTLVGSNPSLSGMLNRQRFQLEGGLHPDKELQADWKELGPDAFAFETLDLLKPSDDPGYDPSEDLRALKEMWLENLTASDVPLYPRSRRDT
jgi:RimJ/RimL family protein N-acetyltransferase